MKPEDASFHPMAGALLAASPALQDPNFRETLVYLAEHSEDGAFGLVMNRPLGKVLGDVVTLPDLSEKLANTPVLYGGPVQPSHLVVAMFSVGKCDNELICQLNTSLTDAANFLEMDQGWVVAFAGYSGWGEGQLEGELGQHAWKVCQPDPILFDEKMLTGLWGVYVADDDRWRGLMSYLPDEPELN